MRLIKNNIRALISLVLLTLLVFALSTEWAGLPPIGKVLDPMAGLFRNKPQISNEQINGAEDLIAEVDIYYEDRGVPHVFAKNDHDLYFAQGYAEAKDRYWQMEFMAFSAAGRLSEVLGQDYLDYDRFIRRMGMLLSAEESLELIKNNDPVTYDALLAYTAGVNTYVNQLDYKFYPLEYKLMNYAPEEWTVLNSILVMKLVAYNLSSYEEDYQLTQLYYQLGSEQFQSIFSGELPDPNSIAKENDLLFASNDQMTLAPEFLQSFKGIGSNSWIVGGNKTENGNTFFCADPHLSLSYPSFWYEIQLKSDEQNVYGVSIPGVPGIMMGFNDNIAFSTTNGQADVKDWYQLEMAKDGESYMLDGKEEKFAEREETYKIKGGLQFTDKIKTAIQGPLINGDGFIWDSTYLNMALNWEMQNASNDIGAFLGINRAKNKAEFNKALTGFSCPTQNFLFAETGGNIAYSYKGRIKKNRVGNGRFIINGTKRKYFTQNYVANADLPYIENPVNDILFSTNQLPDTVGGKEVPYGYFSDTRHLRLKELLTQSNKHSIEDMKEFQMDNLNVFARAVLYFLREKLDLTNRDEYEQKILKELLEWDYRFNGDAKAPLVYQILWTEMEHNLYDKWPDSKLLPEKFQSLSMLEKYDTVGLNQHQWTSLKSVDDLIDLSIATTIDSLKNLDEIHGENLSWGEVNRIQIGHLTRIGTFGSYDLKSNGHPNVLNATSRNWGPSWRMVLELGDEITGYGVYPGAQNGSPNSKKYEEFTDTWYKGEYYTFQFFKNIDEAKSETQSSINLRK